MQLALTFASIQLAVQFRDAVAEAKGARTASGAAGKRLMVRWLQFITVVDVLVIMQGQIQRLHSDSGGAASAVHHGGWFLCDHVTKFQRMK